MNVTVACVYLQRRRLSVQWMISLVFRDVPSLETAPVHQVPPWVQMAKHVSVSQGRWVHNGLQDLAAKHLSDTHAKL